ncbi:MAG: hypothetical protein WCK51_05840 [Armatimonadota bacterium]
MLAATLVLVCCLGQPLEIGPLAMGMSPLKVESAIGPLDLDVSGTIQYLQGYRIFRQPDGADTLFILGFYNDKLVFLRKQDEFPESSVFMKPRGGIRNSDTQLSSPIDSSGNRYEDTEIAGFGPVSLFAERMNANPFQFRSRSFGSYKQYVSTLTVPEDLKSNLLRTTPTLDIASITNGPYTVTAQLPGSLIVYDQSARAEIERELDELNLKHQTNAAMSNSTNIWSLAPLDASSPRLALYVRPGTNVQEIVDDVKAMGAVVLYSGNSARGGVVLIAVPAKWLDAYRGSFSKLSSILQVIRVNPITASTDPTTIYFPPQSNGKQIAVQSNVDKLQKFLKNYYQKPALTITLLGRQCVRAQISKFRGVVIENRNYWEKLDITFFIETGSIVMLPQGEYATGAGTKPPSDDGYHPITEEYPRAFANYQNKLVSAIQNYMRHN